MVVSEFASVSGSAAIDSRDFANYNVHCLYLWYFLVEMCRNGSKCVEMTKIRLFRAGFVN